MWKQQQSLFKMTSQDNDKIFTVGILQGFAKLLNTQVIFIF